MITRRSRSTALVLAAILLAGPALSGCSIISNFLPGGSGELPGGVVPGQSVPADFPSDVPLIELSLIHI